MTGLLFDMDAVAEWLAEHRGNLVDKPTLGDQFADMLPDELMSAALKAIRAYAVHERYSLRERGREMVVHGTLTMNVVSEEDRSAAERRGLELVLSDDALRANATIAAANERFGAAFRSMHQEIVEADVQARTLQRKVLDALEAAVREAEARITAETADERAQLKQRETALSRALYRILAAAD